MKEGWKKYTLGELGDILDSQRKPVTKSDRKSGIFPYYGASGIQDYVDSYIFDGRFLLLGEDGAKWGANDKSAYIIEGKSWVNNHAHIIKVNSKIVIDRLLEYYLTHKDLSAYITGAVVPKLTQKAMALIEIPVPPLSEQQQIVEELDLLSGIIEKKKKQLKELDNLAQSIFYDMFGDPNNSDYPIKKLETLSNFKLSYGSGASAVEYNGKNRYIRITDIDDDGSLKSDIFSPNVIEDKYFIQEGDILFARSGATVGKTYQCKQVDIDSIFAGYLIRFIPNRNLVLPTYVYHFTKTIYYSNFIAKSSNAVAQPNVNAKQYGNLEIPVPPLSLQQSFASKIEAIEKMKQNLKDSIKETETLFQSRMDYWFNV